MRRSLPVLVLVLGLALLASGCAVKSATVTQVAPIGDVTVTVVLCMQGLPNGTACPTPQGEGAVDLAGQHADGQVLFALRVPVGVEPIAPPDRLGGQVLTWTASPTYVAELERLFPPPAGTHWLGYISNEVKGYATAAAVQSHTLAIELSLPRGADGTPFQAPLVYLPIVGIRINNAPDDPMSVPRSPARPVHCDQSLVSATDGTSCMMDPDPTSMETKVRTAETRDLGVVATASVGSTLAGGITSVPFSLQYAGQPHPLADFSLTAATGLPGGTATPQTPTFKPLANSGTAILVSVSVPAGTAPGTYPVTLTAASANGMSRSGTGSVVVLAPPADPGAGGPPPDPGAPPPPAPDTARPTARIALPACRPALTRVRCAALRARPASWRVLRGTASDATPSSGLPTA